MMCARHFDILNNPPFQMHDFLTPCAYVCSSLNIKSNFNKNLPFGIHDISKGVHMCSVSSFITVNKHKWYLLTLVTNKQGHFIA